MIEALAIGALTGVPIARVIDADAVEAALWMRIIRRTSELQSHLIKAQASHTADQVSRLFKRR